MKEIGISDVLAQMRALKAQAQNMPTGTPVESTQPGQKVEFGDLLKSQIDKVNEVMKTSGELSKDFIQGKPGITEVEVMLASQKSSVAYTALNEVRNKLLNAYKEVMSMSV